MTWIANTVLEKDRANATSSESLNSMVIPGMNWVAANSSGVKKPMLATICTRVVPQTAGSSNSAGRSFRPMLNSSRVTPISDSSLMIRAGVLPSSNNTKPLPGSR